MVRGLKEHVFLGLLDLDGLREVVAVDFYIIDRDVLVFEGKVLFVDGGRGASWNLKSILIWPNFIGDFDWVTKRVPLF